MHKRNVSFPFLFLLFLLLTAFFSGRLSCDRCTKLKRKCGITEEDSRKGSGGKRKRVAADDGEDEKRKTRSTAEPDWVGRVMDGINGVLRTMEENEKRAQSFRRGLESRLQVMEGNMVELGRMVKVGVNTIMADQYEMRMAIERDDEAKGDGEDEAEVTAEVTAETGVEAVAEATAETTSEAAPSSPA